MNKTVKTGRKRGEKREEGKKEGRLEVVSSEITEYWVLRIRTTSTETFPRIFSKRFPPPQRSFSEPPIPKASLIPGHRTLSTWKSHAYSTQGAFSIVEQLPMRKLIVKSRSNLLEILRKYGALVDGTVGRRR